MGTQVSAERERLSIAFTPPVARITLDNPPVNVIDFPMMAGLASALAEIEARSDISIVIFSGEGDAFSAGVDVAAHSPENVAAMLSGFHAGIRALVGTRKVTIAVVQGNCL